MNQPKITNSEQARNFYKKHIHGCPRGCDLYDTFTPETLKAYEDNSSQELEDKWAFEEFEKFFAQIAPKNPDNHKLLNKAWEWYNESTPVKFVAEKLEIMLNDSNGKPDAKLLDCMLEAAGDSEINKVDKSEEQTLIRLMDLCCPFISEEKADKLRFMIVGPVSEEETKQQYRMNGFCGESYHFQTVTAEQNFKRYATPENMLRWKQEYFDEWTGKEYYLSKENTGLVSVVELAALKGIYGKENTQKLYNKLSDYKNCAAPDQYWHLAFEAVSKLSKPLFDDGEYDMLNKFYELAADMLDDAPKSWNRDYFGNLALKDMEEYLNLIEEKRNG